MGVLVSSRVGRSLQTVELTPIGVNKVLRYVVGQLGGAICLTVAVPSHHIPEARPRADVAYNFFDHIYVVGIVAGFLAALLGVCLQLWFWFHSVFCFVAMVS